MMFPLTFFFGGMLIAHMPIPDGLLKAGTDDLVKAAAGLLR